MGRPIGYYVHHHGDGHRQRALAIVSASDQNIVLLGTNLAGRTGGAPSIDLPDDRMLDAAFDGADTEANRPDALHYAPIDHDGVRQRAAIITSWIARERPSLLVVDVSVEIAMLSRLTSTPTLYVRLAGRRDDTPHLEAFRGARALLAPFAADLDDEALPDWIREKTTYASGLTATSPTTIAELGCDVLVVLGRGGTSISGDRLAAAARATPDMQWRVAGDVSSSFDCPGNLTMLGWTDHVGAEIEGARIVIGSAGDGLVSAVLARPRPFVCLPESRPFDEQRSKAWRLADAGVAITLEDWPAPGAWNDVLARACALDIRNAERLHDSAGAAKAARLIASLARPQT